MIKVIVFDMFLLCLFYTNNKNNVQFSKTKIFQKKIQQFQFLQILIIIFIFKTNLTIKKTYHHKHIWSMNITTNRIIHSNSFLKYIIIMQTIIRYFDIAANLTSQQFQGIYNVKQIHPPDIQQVIQRAKISKCTHLLIAASCLKDSIQSNLISQKYPNLYSTIGVHPCQALNVTKTKQKQQIEKYFQQIEENIKGKIAKLVAIGQCGLDYDRFQFADKETQLLIFPYHFQLSSKYNLPMYFHNRNTGNDFFNIVKQNRHKFNRGVVHSFTGTKQQLQQILQLDLQIGLNGCSLKTIQNIEIAKLVPLQKLHLQTDSPYCQIRPSHQSFKYVDTNIQQRKKEKYSKQYCVKGRNQPCRIVQVAEAVSKILKISLQQLSIRTFENSMNLFNIKNN